VQGHYGVGGRWKGKRSARGNCLITFNTREYDRGKNVVEKIQTRVRNFSENVKISNFSIF
jgi:hypothetical protein